MIASLLVCLVVGVSDGDTITARCGEPGAYEQVKVRVQGIDAPERKQPFGARSRQAFSDLVFQRRAELRCGKTDRYQRKVCSVWVAPAASPDGPRTLDAGLSMVSSGMAWWYRSYSREQTPQDRARYRAAEDGAREQRVGLWVDAAPVAPWDWRKGNR
ncbi:MAG: thermonuclease family protein [Comamonadaceae bacterium]|nr:MAG: thermonuclease family protein [Comamonadaceae bacterium]